MPPKFKFTKEDIISAALDITRKNGISALTARALGEKLGSSSKPIFGLFENMQEVQQSVINAANSLYQEYLRKDMNSEKYPPYKAAGMAYIRFAREETQLFKLLFMRNRETENLEENREEIRPYIDIIMKNLSIDEDKAVLFHLELWIYVHGIATMIATGYLNWDTDSISNTLTDAYFGLKHRLTEN